MYIIKSKENPVACDECQRYKTSLVVLNYGYEDAFNICKDCLKKALMNLERLES